MRIFPTRIQTLWTLFTAPMLWAAHFLFCYVLAAVWCAKRGGGLGLVQAGIAAATVLALVLIALSAWLAWRQWGFGIEDPPHDDPTARDRTLFQGFATLLLSGLSFLGLGAQPPTAEWGAMVADGAQNFSDWWVGVFPGLAILTVVLAFNFIGDTLRDLLDPRTGRPVERSWRTVSVAAASCVAANTASTASLVAAAAFFLLIRTRGSGDSA